MDAIAVPAKKIVPEFLKAISSPRKEEDANKPMPENMDFPTLDDLVGDVPLMDASMRQIDVSEEDENLDMQYLMHVAPNLSMTALGL